MNNFELCLLRLKQQLGVKEDQAVADLLGMKKAAFSSRKKRDAFPVDAVRELAKRKPELSLDIDYVLSGARELREVVGEYRIPARSTELWRNVLEAVIDELNRRGKTLPGEKVLALTDLITDYCHEGEVDKTMVERHLRLVA